MSTKNIEEAVASLLDRYTESYLRTRLDSLAPGARALLVSEVTRQAEEFIHANLRLQTRRLAQWLNRIPGAASDAPYIHAKATPTGAL